ESTIFPYTTLFRSEKQNAYTTDNRKQDPAGFFYPDDPLHCKRSHHIFYANYYSGGGDPLVGHDQTFPGCHQRLHTSCNPFKDARHELGIPAEQRGRQAVATKPPTV